MEEKKEEIKVIAAFNTSQNNVADPVDALREILRLKDKIRRPKN